MHLQEGVVHNSHASDAWLIIFPLNHPVERPFAGWQFGWTPNFCPATEGTRPKPKFHAIFPYGELTNEPPEQGAPSQARCGAPNQP